MVKGVTVRLAAGQVEEDTEAMGLPISVQMHVDSLLVKVVRVAAAVVAVVPGMALTLVTRDTLEAGLPQVTPEMQAIPEIQAIPPAILLLLTVFLSPQVVHIP